MSIIRKKLKLTRVNYYSMHLSMMNVFLPVKLTPKEIETLAHFMSLRGDIAEDMFGTSARKIVMQKMGIKPGGLGNYLDSLSTKKFLLPHPTKKFEIWSTLYPDDGHQDYQFQFIEENE